MITRQTTRRAFPWNWLMALSTALVAPGFESNAQEPTAYVVEASNDQWTIKRNGELVAAYHQKSGSKPIVWPLIGPDGVELTRKWPMSDADASEKKDHPHHRSLWFTHGEVNDVDFWAEGNERGSVVLQGSPRIEANDKHAILEATHHWQDATGKRLLREDRRMTFHGTKDLPILDFDFTLTASDVALHFGDTKEGTFGIRVAESMKLETTPPGSILNAEGAKDNDAWGKVSNWVDYSGPVGGGIYGIAVMVHPSSFRHPGRWHVRGYGLFAHNPFGLKHFVNDDQAVGGGHDMPLGSSLSLSYRVILHRGQLATTEIDEYYREYAATNIAPIKAD